MDRLSNNLLTWIVTDALCEDRLVERSLVVQMTLRLVELLSLNNILIHLRAASLVKFVLISTWIALC